MDELQRMLRRWKRALSDLFANKGQGGKPERPQIKMCPICGKFVEKDARNCEYCEAELQPGSRPTIDTQGSGEPLNPTVVLFTICIVMYFISLVFSSKEAVDRHGLFSMLDPVNVVLFRLGANSSAFVFDGQWWRLITYIFLHGGVMHIVMNMMALAQLGPLVFQSYGNVRFWLITIITGIAGGLASALLSFNSMQHLSVGFSGSLFGFLGISYVYCKNNGHFHEAERLKKFMIWGNVILIGLTYTNIMRIDNAAHLGGMFMGLAMGYAFETRFMKFLNPKFERLAVYALFLWWAFGLFRCVQLIHSGYG